MKVGKRRTIVLLLQRFLYILHVSTSVLLLSISFGNTTEESSLVHSTSHHIRFTDSVVDQEIPQTITAVRYVYRHTTITNYFDFSNLEFSLAQNGTIALNLSPSFDQFQVLMPRVIARLLDHISTIQLSTCDARARYKLMRQWEMRIPSIRQLLKAGQTIESKFQTVIRRLNYTPTSDRDITMEAEILNTEASRYASAFLEIIEEIL